MRSPPRVPVAPASSAGMPSSSLVVLLGWRSPHCYWRRPPSVVPVDPVEVGASATVSRPDARVGVPERRPIGVDSAWAHRAYRPRRRPGALAGRGPPPAGVPGARRRGGRRRCEDGVDRSGLNLARLVADGEQVLVGIAAPAGAVAARGVAGGPAPPDGAPGQPQHRHARAFDALPGIGPVLADGFSTGGRSHGRFSTVDELRRSPASARRPSPSSAPWSVCDRRGRSGRGRLPVVPAAVARGGVLAGVAAGRAGLVGIGVSLAVAAVLVFRRVRHRSARVAVLVALICLVGGAGVGWARAAGVRAGPVDDLAAAGAVVTVAGVLTTDPHIRTTGSGRAGRSTSSGGYGSSR